jgi:integrase
VTAQPIGGLQPGRPGGLERLMAAVRAEFRADVLVFPATDPVFGGGACRVAGCRRAARGHGLCQGHHLRWAGQGRPGLDTFAATTGPGWERQRPNGRCRAAGCGYGVARRGVCQLHWQRFERSGGSDLQAFLADPLPVKTPPPGVTCRIDCCTLWPQAQLPFCHAHANTWKVNGRPDIAAFAATFAAREVTEDETIRLGALSPRLRLEVQYALQCRAADRAAKTLPPVVMRMVRFLAITPAASLLQLSEQQWRAELGRRAPKDTNARSLLIYARRKVDDLFTAGGWDAEFPRDVWQLRRLGYPGNQTLDFTVIPQPWLRDLVRRWLRWRMGTGLHLEVARRGLRSMARFARFCDRIGVTGLAAVDRTVIEAYLAGLHAELAGRQRHNDQIGQLNAFLHAARQHRWDDSLPATALIFPDDYPKRAERLPRALAEHVMAQVEHPDNLGRWASPAYRLVTLILIRAGLRVTDALRLEHDCVVADAAAAPYLRYVNHKMKRQALVPIDEELRELISEQQRRVAEAIVNPAWLFPRPTKNPDGAAPTASGTYRLALYRWLQHCEIRDEHGRPVHFTPHQWRHTLGTRLINRDVPQEVVRRILDHDSAQMTGHYARLHDSTVRRHWEAARKIDIAGNTVNLDADGPLAEATWASQRLGQATQALPNGYCGLPVQQSCPHANACLTCPMFLTTAQFLPQHRAQRQQALQVISAAEARGQARLAEMNRQVLANLDRIITALDDNPGDERQEHADAS